MDELLCSVCATNELLTEAELINDMCSACLNASETYGPEQDFDEYLFFDIGGEA